MPWDRMVDVLRGVSLVVHDKAARAKAEVLHQDCVAGQRAASDVFDIDAPEPEGRGWMKPQRHAMAQTSRLALPHKAIPPRAEIGLCTRPHRFDNGRIRPAGSDKHAHDPAAEGRAKHLIEHGAAAAFLML